MEAVKDYLIDAKKLKNILLNKSNFADWIKKNIKINNLVEEKDFFVKKEKIDLLRNGKTYKINYFLTLEAAKKIVLKSQRNKTAMKIKEELEKGFELNDILNEEQKRMKIIKICDEEYPKLLKNIKNPPQQLYVKGNIKNLEEYGIAVIGTRHCSMYGRRICRIFTKNLVGYNLNIISGLAIGIDGCAHKACIEAKGKTIAVLPSGFNHIFPKENEELLNNILEKGGTIITEYPPDFEKTQESCRERNRIMSGLSIATLVIEAEKRSGTNITVEYAIEQDKKVFCIPSSLLNRKGIGTNLMIKQKKAQIVTEVEDIIKEFSELELERKTNFEFFKIQNNNTKSTSKKKSKEKTEIDQENLDVYNALSKEPKYIDEIAQELNKPINEIAYKLSMLNIQGAIEELPGNKFKTK